MKAQLTTAGHHRTLRPRENPELYVEALLLRKLRLPMSRAHAAVLFGGGRECSTSYIWSVERTALGKIRKCAEESRVFG